MKRILLALIFISSTLYTSAQVGFNNPNPDASSLLDLKANDKGLLIPRMSSAQRDAIGSPAESLLVFDTDKQGFYFRQGGNWYALNEWVKNANSNDVSLSGNASVTGTMSSNALSSNTLTNSGSISTGTLTSSGNISSSTLNTTGSASMGSVSTSSVSSSGNISAGSLSVGGFSTNALAPTGIIVMWSGAIGNIPSGWALCDGSSGRPDLRGRFIAGYSGFGYYNSIGNTGGEEFHSLTASENGPHTHAIATSNGTAGYGKATVGNEAAEGTLATASNGSGTPHENRPPYYTLAYIIKL